MTNPEPPPPRPIEYAGPTPHPLGEGWVTGSTVGDVFFAALLFGASHWVAEYCTGRALRDWDPAVRFFDTPSWLRMSDKAFEWDLCVETGYAMAAAVVLLCVGLLARCTIGPPRRRRPLGWLASAGLGVAFCWSRWVIGRLASRWHVNYSEGVDFMVAMSLAAGCAALMLPWWRPSRRQPATG